jgi:hypothetical protein
LGFNYSTFFKSFLVKSYNFLANGVEFLGAPQEMEWGTFVRFKDEDGNQFLLKQ